MHFAMWLQEQLYTRKLKSKKFADEIGIHPSTVSHWLKGKREPDSTNLKKTLDFFCSNMSQKRVHLHWIYYGKPVYTIKKG